MIKLIFFTTTLLLSLSSYSSQLSKTDQMKSCIASFIPKVAKTVPSPIEGSNYIIFNPYACGIKVEESLSEIHEFISSDDKKLRIRTEVIHMLINEKHKQTKLSNILDWLFSD